MATFIRRCFTCTLKRHLSSVIRINSYPVRNFSWNQSTRVCSVCSKLQNNAPVGLHHAFVRNLHNEPTNSSPTIHNMPLQKQIFWINRHNRITSGSNFLIRRNYSDGSSSDRDGIGDHNPDGTLDYAPPEENFRKSLVPVTVPEFFPNVPVIAINKNPVYPKFMKMIEVVDPDLQALIKLKVRLGQPYAGVFIKKEESDESEVVNKLEDLHDVGVFVHITETMETDNNKLGLYVVAHRTIKINKLLECDEDLDSLQLQIKELSEKLASDRPKRKLKRRLRNRNNNHNVEDLADEKLEGDLNANVHPIKPASLHEGISDDSIKDVSQKKVLYVETENYDLEPYEQDDMMKAHVSEVIKTIKDLISMNPLFRDNVGVILNPVNKVFDNPVFICNLGAMLSSAEPKEQQEVLEETNVRKKISLVLDMLKKEYERCKMQRQIGEEVEKKIREKNKEYFLKEQLKVIKKELGIQKDEGASLKDKYLERLKDKEVPEQAMKVIDEEIDRLLYLDGDSSEFNSVRNYLDWLTILPWGVETEENLDIKNAQEILDEDHYGMKDIKDRILEFIAVSHLKGNSQGKILCFHGPPGVGKTSIAKSIARAINRKYYRFSVGGLHDVSEIKGHRRTYVGSMPGKMIQCLKRTQSENPLVLIDEIDKLGRRGYEGDPSSALLELLDPEQNNNFLDHFLDVPVDMSKVLFLCTANVISTIPEPLKDRMEFIEISGYVSEEKLNIAQKYLIPQVLEKSGLKEEHISVTDDVLYRLIDQYCRESGVRNLSKKIEKIYRKAALKVVTSIEPQNVIEVTTDNLTDFVGQPVYSKERLYETTPPGVVTGLAWTGAGGCPLYIEVAKIQDAPEDNKDAGGMGSLKVTGNLGNVMKESTDIAYSYSMSWMQKHFKDNHFFKRSKLHLHVPEGATPKDGPSAGCAITTALLSLAMDTPCNQNMAMTGEISLTGKLLKIGGVKEKILAVKREGLKTVILPSENKSDFEELPDFIKEGLDVYFVKQYDEVFKIAFPNVSLS